MTRLYFTTDVHGSETCFRKFLNTPKFYNADVIVLGGDLTGKVVIPILKLGGNSYIGELRGREYKLEGERAVAEFEHKVAMAGFYTYRTTQDELSMLESDNNAVEDLFTQLICERVEQWLELADERLEGQGVDCYISPGNDDIFEIDPLLDASKMVSNPEGRVVQIDDLYEMASYGWSTFTPWNSPRECSEDDMASNIAKILSQVRCMENCIFNFHCPPYNTKIDSAPKLDEDLRPVMGGEGMEMMPVGSKAVRSAIEEHQPLLGLHGHVHESRGVHRLGRTLAINPGSTYTDGTLLGVIIELPNKSRGEVSYQLVGG